MKKLSYAQTAKQPTGINQGSKAPEILNSTGSKQNSSLNASAKNENSNISPVSSGSIGSSTTGKGTTTQREVSKNQPTTSATLQSAPAPAKSAWISTTGSKKNFPNGSQEKSNPSLASTNKSSVAAPTINANPAPTGKATQSSAPKPAAAPVKNAWAIPRQTSAKSSTVEGPIPDSLKNNALLSSSVNIGVSPALDQAPTQPQVQYHPQQYQPHYDQGRFNQFGNNFQPQQSPQQQKKDYQKKNTPQIQPPQQPIPYYPYQQMPYHMYPMYGMPMVPPQGGAPYSGANQTPSFTIRTSKKVTIKIVDPSNNQEIKLPVKSEASTSKAAFKPDVVSQPPIAVADADVQSKKNPALKQNAHVAETPIKKSSAAVFKDPATGEIFIPKAIPITISKPPAARATSQAGYQQPVTVIHEKSKVEEVPAVPKVATISKLSALKIESVQINTAENSIPEKSKATIRSKSPAAAEKVLSVADVKPKPTMNIHKPVVSNDVAEVKQTSSTTINGAEKAKSPNFITPFLAKPPGFENAYASSPVGTEEGEITSETLPDVPKLTSFEGLTYPADLTPADIPSKKAGYIQYSFNFFISVGKIVSARPLNMANWKDIYGDEAQSKPPTMRRQASEGRGGQRGRGGAARGGRGGQAPHMSRQASSGPFSSSSHSSRGSGRGGRSKHIPHVQAAPPLMRGENAYDPRKKTSNETEAILKSIKGLLNKMTLDNFEKLSGKILESKIEDENVLVGMITLICEKAIDEPHFSTVYAMLCFRLFVKLPEFQTWICPTGIVQENMFRKSLLKRCQEEFEKDAKWAEDDAAAQVERAEMRLKIDELSAEEKLRIAEEDYERKKLKRRVLGNIRFVGELFLQGIISESIIHHCICRLVGNENIEEEDVESLCKLVTATGKRLDHQKSKEVIDSYFERMEDLSKMEDKFSSRIRFLLMDVLDLRKTQWVNTKISQVKSIAQVKQEIEKEEREKERAKSQRGKGGGGVRLNKGSSTSGNRPDRDDRRSKPSDEGDWKAVGEHAKQNEITLRSGKSHIYKNKRTSPSSISSEQHAAAPSAKLTNSFDALENMSSSKPLSSVEQVAEVSQMNIMMDAFKNFKDSLEPAELIEDLENVDEESVLETLVHKLAQLLLDFNGKPASQIIKIFSSLFLKEEAKNPITPFVQGIKKFFVSLEDDRSDFPNAFTNLSQVLGPLFTNSGLDFDTLIDITSPIAVYAGRNPVLPDFLADFLKCNESPLRFLIDMQFDIRRFFPEGKVIASIEDWIKSKTRYSRDAAKMKVFNDVEIIQSLMVSLYENAGLELDQMDYYRFVNRDSDEIAKAESFNDFLATAFLKIWTIQDIFGGSFENKAALKTKDLYVTLRNQVSNLKPILDFLDSPLDLLRATESFLFTHSINYLLEDIFRIYYDMESVQESVYFDFKNTCKPDSEKILTGWFKYLKDH